MKACTYCGRDNEDSASRCRECGTDRQTPEIRQPLSTRTKIFIALCVATPSALALAYPMFTLSLPLSAACALVGLLLSIVLFVRSLLSLFCRWQQALLGFGCLLVAFWFLVVMADIFAAYQHRKHSAFRGYVWSVVASAVTTTSSQSGLAGEER